VNSLADRHGGGCWTEFTIGTGAFARSLCLLVACSATIHAATAQAPEAPPAKGFILHEQRQVDRFRRVAPESTRFGVNRRKRQ
jgi:hypothetical protein